MKTMKYAMVLAVATASASFAFADDAMTPTPAANAAATPATPADQATPTMANAPKHTPLNTEETANVYTRLSNIVNSATTKNGFNDLVGDLAKAERDRLTNEHYSDMTAINTQIDQFRNDFRAKYGQEFMITAASFGGVQVWQGKDQNTAVVPVAELRHAESIKWDGTRASSANDTSNGITNGDKTANSPLHNNSTADDESKQNNDSDNPGNRNAPSPKLKYNSDITQNNLNDNKTENNPTGMPNGRTDMQNAADAQAGMARAKLHLTNEGMLGNGWRLDVNDQTSAQNISDSVSKALAQLHDNQASWPSDVKQAYRVVATNVLEAVNAATPAPQNATVENR
jgi:hypothetical protein